MRSDCPLNYGLEIFGDRWSLLIIRDLMFFGKRTYNEFLTSREAISTNILANRLAFLEKEKIIAKEKDAHHKQRWIYHLTEKGIDLLPIIINIGLWSAKHAAGQTREMDVVLGPVKKNYTRGIRSMKTQLCKQHLKRS